MTIRLTYRKVKCLIEVHKGYKLLSDEYVNNNTKLLVQCPNNHRYQTSWTLFQRGIRCSHCARNTITYQQIKYFIKSQGYKLLSKWYKNAHNYLSIQCPNDHQYEATWNTFQQGHRCPYCSGNKKLAYQQVERFIGQQGYKLLSVKYVNAHKKLLIQCTKKHQYKTTWANFKLGNRCPQCRHWRGEKRLYKLLRQVFPNHNITRQDNLDFLGRQRVDFAIRDLKLAFEYDGEQHFRPVQYGGISLKKAKREFSLTQQRDKKKKELCKQNLFKLIRIRYDEELTKNILQNKTAGA